MQAGQHLNNNIGYLIQCDPYSGKGGHNAKLGLGRSVVTKLAQPAFICSKLTIETVEQGVNMFKVNNKDTGTTPMASFWYLYC